MVDEWCVCLREKEGERGREMDEISRDVAERGKEG